MIAFKRIASVEEWPGMHRMMREVLIWLADRWPDSYMEVTRIFTPSVAGESGVHRTKPHRGADVRTNDLDPAVGQNMADAVNDAYEYGDGRHSVALQHGVGPNRHLHLQVRDETKPRVRDGEPTE